MAVDATWLDTINVALTRIGQRRITSAQLTTPDSKTSREVDASFQFHLDTLADDHPWHFLIKRAELTKDSTAAAWGPKYSYVLPADCIRVLDVNNDQIWGWPGQGNFGIGSGWHPGSAYAVWKTESVVDGVRRIVTDVGDDATGDTKIQIRYLRTFPAATPGATATPLFKSLLAYWLGIQWAEAMTASDTLDEKLEMRYRSLLMEARSIASQEGTPSPLVTSAWVNSRIA